MMKRLTYEAEDQHGSKTGAVWYHAMSITTGESVFPQSEKEKSALKKLSRYENAEEQGRLVVLPCKVGDTVWFVVKERLPVLAPEVYHGTVREIKAVQRKENTLFLAIVEYIYPDPWWDDGRFATSEIHCSYTEYGSWVSFFVSPDEAKADARALLHQEGGNE